MNGRDRDVKRIRRRPSGKSRLSGQGLGQLGRVDGLLQQGDPGQNGQPIGRGQRVARLAFPHNKPRRIQLELNSFRPPFPGDLLMRGPDEIPTRAE
jgi:hypothetical protein